MSDEPTNEFSVGSDEFDTIIKQMQVHCAAFAKVVNDFDQTLGPLAAGFHMLKLSQILKMLDILHFLHDVGEEVKKYKGREGATLERIANETMLDEDIEAIVQDGYKYVPELKNRFNVTKANSEDFMLWAKNDERARELITESIHHKTLEKLLNGMLEDGEMLPPMVSHFQQPVVVRRKQRGS